MPYTIRELRERAGLTQEKLAEEIEVAPMTIRRWESARASPRLLHQRCLATFFRVHINEIANAPVKAELE